MAAPHPATIDAYIAAAPAAGQPHLRQLHALLQGVAPKAEQVIKWGLAGIAGAVCGAGGAGDSGLKSGQRQPSILNEHVGRHRPRARPEAADVGQCRVVVRDHLLRRQRRVAGRGVRIGRQRLSMLRQQLLI